MLLRYLLLLTAVFSCLCPTRIAGVGPDDDTTVEIIPAALATLNSDIKNGPTLVYSSSSACKTKKRIVVEVSRSGLCNRMLAISSAALLAVVMDRTLELRWSRTVDCRAAYPELFDTHHPRGPYYPFVYNTSQLPNLVRRNETTCRIKILQTAYHNLQIFADQELFERLDKNCSVIFIESNQFFGHLILGQAFNDMSNVAKKILPYLFRNISRVLFTPEKYILKLVEDLRQHHFVGRKSLSIHIRGYLSFGNTARYLFACANKLVSNGDIDQIMFVSESAKFTELAHEYITNQSILTIPKKELIQDKSKHVDSQKIRNRMDLAVTDWYLLGEADYCMSSTMATSTFSATSITRGRCKYINYKECFLENAISNKEHLLYEGNRHTTSDILRVNLTEEKREKIWKAVVQTVEPFDEQCYEDSDSFMYSHQVVIDYWRSRYKRKF